MDPSWVMLHGDITWCLSYDCRWTMPSRHASVEECRGLSDLNMPGLQLCTDLRPWLLMASWKHRSLSTTSMIHPVSQDKRQTFIYNINIYIRIYRKCHASCVVSNSISSRRAWLKRPSHVDLHRCQLNSKCAAALLHTACRVRYMPGSLQLKHVFADCLWMRSRATGGGNRIHLHQFPSYAERRAHRSCCQKWAHGGFLKRWHF